jgi:hypothetical protein
MKTEAQFSDHEKRLLHDFLCRRPKYLTTVNALIGVTAIAFLTWLFPVPDTFTQVAVAGLSGALIGVYFEQRHIGELRAIFKKASVDILGAEPEAQAQVPRG